MSIDFDSINERALRLAREALRDRKLSALPPGRMIFSAISGGHMYGFPSPDSDIDVRGCHLLPIDRVIGLMNADETFQLVGERVDGIEIDLVSHDLRKYLKLLLKNGGYILEQIFSPLVVEESDSFRELRELAKGAITRQVLHHYGGFYRRQRGIVATETPLLAKSVLYLFRVLMTGAHVLETGELVMDSRRLNERFAVSYLPDIWLAKAADREKAQLDDTRRSTYLADADRLAERTRSAADVSPLPGEPQNHAALHDFLVRTRLEEPR